MDWVPLLPIKMHREAPALLKRCIFIRHLTAAVPLLETDNRSLVTGLSLYRDMTCSDGLYLKKSRPACCDRYFIWAKQSTAWRAAMVHSARHITLLSASFHVGQPSWLDWTRETELTRLNGRNFPLHALSFARSFPRAQVAFSSEPSRNLLCATIFDIILTICAYVLTSARVRRRHMLRDTARAAATGPSIFWRSNGSLFAQPIASGLLASHRMAHDGFFFAQF